MKRRTFLRNSGMASAGFFCAPAILKAQKEDPVLGQGDKKYRINKAWSQVDFTKNPVKDCHEMVQDSKGRILLLTNEVRNNVIIYDKKGGLITTWGNEYPG